MRAAVYDINAPAGVKMCNRPWPMRRAQEPGWFSKGTVLCEVRACGVNPVDAKYLIGDKVPESWMAWAGRRVSGLTPGFDFSGTVIDAPASSNFTTGDEVYGLACNPSSVWRGRMYGSFAEVVAAPLDQLAPKPMCLTFAEAAALPLAGTTCIQAYEQHGLSSGQRVLIIGASGGVGHLAVQLATGMGAWVAGVCSTKNVSFVKKCGAKVVFDYHQEDIFSKIETEARTNGAFDLVFDCVSSADARDEAQDYPRKILEMTPSILTAVPHNYVVLGGRTSDWALAALKRFTGLNLFRSGVELFWITMPGAATALGTLGDMVENKGLRANIETLPFNEDCIRQAFEALRGRRTVGKIVLELKRSSIDDSICEMKTKKIPTSFEQDNSDSLDH